MMFATLPLLLLWFTAVCAVADTVTTTPSALELEPCRLPGTSIKAKCGALEVPENPQVTDGKQIAIHFAVLPALADNARPDPLFMFSGGPGQAAIEGFAPSLPYFGKVRRNRDIVLIDQRGTGTSAPLQCQQGESLLQQEQELQPEALKVYVEECLQQLPGDPRFYTTEITVGDFDKVRQALGYDQVNVLGVSYGTRVAQTYLRRFPNIVRSAVLDGVVPTDLILGSEHAEKLQQALQAIFNRCEKELECGKRFPDLEQKLELLIDRSETKPQTLVVPEPRTGKPTEIEVTRGVLAQAIRLLSYAPETQALLPLLIHEAAQQDNLARIAGQAMLVKQSLQTTISRIEWSVLCSEDAPHYPALTHNDKRYATLLGDAVLKPLQQLCKIWPRGEVSADFHTPFKSDTPALLLSGEFDPVTPSEYGERARQQFSDALHLVVKGQGHGINHRGCLPTVIAQFLEAGTTGKLGTRCLQSFDNTPFFTTLMGAEP